MSVGLKPLTCISDYSLFTFLCDWMICCGPTASICDTFAIVIALCEGPAIDPIHTLRYNPAIYC